jgi:DNA-binding response OmpR family regulator
VLDIIEIEQVGTEHAERPRILLVEDDSTLRGYLTDCLEVAGYEVIATHDGVEGWRAFELRSPHVVVVDLDLPVMSGFRLLQLMRRETRAGGRPVPVIVTTGYDLQEVHDLAIEVRPEVYLKKPFTAHELIANIDHLLARPPKPSS